MKTNIEKNIVVILFSGLLISLGACVGVLVTENHYLKQPLEFREVTESIDSLDFLAIDILVNETYPDSFLELGFVYFRDNDTVIISTGSDRMFYVGLLCMKEGYFIKYPTTFYLEAIPYGFNSSYLGLHTALYFEHLDTCELRIYNISFWQVIK